MSTENTNLALVPVLRFPEFEGEWERKKLGEISNGIMYGMNAASMQFDGKNKYLRITDIDEDSRIFLPNPLTSPNGLIEEKYKLNEGDIVFTRTGASVGKSYLYNLKDGNLYFAGFLIKFSIIKAIPYFVFSQTLKKTYDNWVQRMSMRSGQPGINAEEYKDLDISLTTLPEQKRIASFFTVLDQKVTQLKQKKNLLVQYKKGVMQQLFSQELRFKADDGNEFPDWESKKLGEVLSIPEKIKPDFIDKTKLLTVKLHLKGIFQNTSTDGLSIGSTNYYVRKKGQFIYGKQNLFNGAFGIIPTEFDGFLSSGDVPVLNVDERKLSSRFLVYFMGREIFYKKLEEIASGSGSKRIHENIFLNVSISIPSLPEQTKIANFLSAIDEKINQTQTQIGKTEQYKKGLLQKMFC